MNNYMNYKKTITYSIFGLCLIILLQISSLDIQASDVYTPVDAVIAFDCKKPEDDIEVTYKICINSDNPNMPMPEEDSVKINQFGKGQFKIRITEPGTFTYHLYQEVGNEKDVKYDSTAYDIYVYVVNNENDQLEYTVSVNYADTATKPSEVIFINTKSKQSSTEKDTASNPPEKEKTETPTRETTDDGSEDEETEEASVDDEDETTEAKTEKKTDESGSKKQATEKKNAKTGDKALLSFSCILMIISLTAICLILKRKYR